MLLRGAFGGFMERVKAGFFKVKMRAEKLIDSRIENSVLLIEYSRILPLFCIIIFLTILK